MEFIVCDAEKNEIMALPKSAEMDWDIGGTNDVQITCEKGLLDFDTYVICPGTEYGALLEEVNTNTSEMTERWLGNSFRCFLPSWMECFRCRMKTVGSTLERISLTDIQTH